MSALNSIISLWYAVLGVLMAVAFLAYIALVSKKEKVDLPSWLLAGFLIGSFAFFFGCGGHHNMVASHLAHEPLTIEGVRFVEMDGGTHYFFAWLQALGAPLAILCGGLIVQRFRQSVNIDRGSS